MRIARPDKTVVLGLAWPMWLVPPLDQQAIEDRQDCLVYTSEPLSEPLLLAGNLRAELFVSADTPDADWVVKLSDVDPDGPAYNLAVGILRGRYRESETQAQLMTPAIRSHCKYCGGYLQ